jgi:hypothetical protein
MVTDDFRYTIDLSTAQKGAEKVVECIQRWRESHDLRRFEYTRQLRVAPNELPHSHPVLTLNTQLFNPEEILSEYLHEQMHWYVEALGCVEESTGLIAELRRRYPQIPVGFPEGANDEFSSYLHLLVNWLEVEATSHFIARERAEAIASRKHYYRWIFRTVLSDWRSLEELFRKHRIVPIVPADRLARSGRA